MHSYSSNKPIILFVVGSLEVGGAENQMSILISRLHGHVCSCHIFVLQAGGALRSYLQNLDVSIYDLFTSGYTHGCSSR
jgi:hypothetical protein